MQENTANSDRSSSDAGSITTRPPSHGPAWKVWQVLKVIQARLRFIAILALIGAAFMFKDTLLSHYDKWVRPHFAESTTASPDTEYWCPMHPTIVRDHPDKCPICGMPLSKRKKGQAADAEEALPPGVVSRVQLTPYRVAAAGIQTVAVDYQPLSKEIKAVGFVEFDERRLARIAVRTTGKSRIDKLYADVTGQTVAKGEPLALVYSPDLVVTVQNLLDARTNKNADLERIARERLALWGIDNDQIDAIAKSGKPITHVTIRSPIGGHVIRKYQVEGDYVDEGARLFDMADLATVWVEAQIYEEDISFMKVGLPVAAATKAFPSREFAGRVAFIHPHLDASTRTLKVRFDMDNPGHDLRPGMYATVTLNVPATQLNLLPQNAGDSQKQAYKQGLVMAVPEQAVIDTGDRKIVYRESEPDLFEGVEVRLGPRCGAFYPVIDGLSRGERVATAGSFLIDAETRLTAGVGSTYFGATGGAPSSSDRRSAATSARPSLSRAESDKVKFALAKLDPSDRRLVDSQQYCPVLVDNRLGSMGAPAKIMVKGQPVFVCCSGCVADALANPQRTLDRAAEFKSRPRKEAEPSPRGRSHASNTVNAKVQANLAKLSPEDRRLAEAQGFCPINPANQLGAMGLPVKIILKGQPVFLCCKGCEEEAESHADQTLDKVRKLKAKSGVTPPCN